MMCFSMLFEILSDLVNVDDVLFVVKHGGVISEVRSGPHHLDTRKKDKWITLGSNDDPAHMHINIELVDHAKFVEEVKPGRTSFSVRFFNHDGERVLAAFFTRMYDKTGILIPERKTLYDEMHQKYHSNIQF